MEINLGIIYKAESSSPLWLARLFQHHLLIDAPSIIDYYFFFLDFSAQSILTPMLLSYCFPEKSQLCLPE